MKINSKHLFNFVYYPGDLTEEEFIFIKNNKEIFSEEIEFLETSKKNELIELNKDDEDKLASEVLKRIKNS